MSKHTHHTKSHSANRVGTSISVDPETPGQFQEAVRASSSSSDAAQAPNYEDVQRRAYQIHQEKGGSDLENWLEAEQELKKRT